MDNPQQAALLNLAALDQRFGQVAQPFNNFANQNTQLAIQREMMAQQQAQAIQRLQFQAQADQQREQQLERMREASAMSLANTAHSSALQISREQEAASLERTKLMETGASKRGTEAEELRINAETAKERRAAADKIRTDPDARRLIGDAISNLSSDDKGNQALIDLYNSRVAGNATALENLHTNDVVGLTKQIRDVTGRLSTTTPGSPEAKLAIQKFLADPAVATTLIKKGKLSPEEVNSVARTGDPQKIIRLIDQASQNASWFGTNDGVAAQLMGSWSAAQVAGKENPGPEQISNLDYLKTLMTQRDAILAKGTINSPEARSTIAKAAGFAPPEVPVIPPSSGLGAPQRPLGMQTPRLGGDSSNPFPTPVIPPTDKIGLARLFAPTVSSDVNAAATRLQNSAPDRKSKDDLRSLAFSPTPIANDPYTEFEARRQMLDQLRANELTNHIATSVIPFVPTYTPKYNEYDQASDEDKLRQFVGGLYSPKQ